MSKVGKAAKANMKKEISEDSEKLIGQLNERIATYLKNHLVPFVKNQESLEEALGNIMANVRLSVEADLNQFSK